MKKILILNVILIFFVLFSDMAYAQKVPGCGSLENHYGPFDYTNAEHIRERLPIVERFHFTEKVEFLRAGESSTLVGDLDYTLRTFPNHHKALYSMLQYRLKHPRQPSEEFFSADCYFKRALAFKPDDGIVWMLYGIYNHKKNNYSAALEKYKTAEKILKGSSDLFYNMGLLYFDMGNIELARKYANLAYGRGYPLPALRKKLESVEKQQ